MNREAVGAGAVVNFFDHQQQARKSSRRLVILYAIAVLVVCVSVAVSIGLLAGLTTDPKSMDRLIVPIGAGLIAAVVTAALVLGGSLYRLAQLRSGGGAVAEAVGGRLINPGTSNPDERRVLNVVEEMAIASGVPVPPVYLIPKQPGINAFAAGYTPGDAVIGVTQGCIEGLTRDELQGVMAHEFSHILNADMRLNIRLLGLLHGILILTIVGRLLLESFRFVRLSSSRDNKGAGAIIVLVMGSGAAFLVFGALGALMARIIQAAVSRQREYLADASAVQFTRNPDGIANALRRIGGSAAGSRVRGPRTGEMNHMYFGEAVSSGFLSGRSLASHPPLDHRIRRVLPSWDGSMLSPLTVGVPRPSEVGAPAARTMATVGTGVAVAASALAETIDLDPLRPPPIIDQIPPMLRDAAGNAFEACCTVFALILSRSDSAVRTSQLAMISEGVNPPAARLTTRLAPAAAGLDLRLRLPLLELALRGLAGMSPDQHNAFRKVVRRLISADGSVDLFEWMTTKALERHLDERFGLASRKAVHYYALDKLGPELSVVLSALARSGSHDAAAIEAAFGAGQAGLTGVRVVLLPTAECGLGRLDPPLETLATVSMPLKAKILAACDRVIHADGRNTHAESELLRAVADTLGVPLPSSPSRA